MESASLFEGSAPENEGSAPSDVGNPAFTRKHFHRRGVTFFRRGKGVRGRKKGLTRTSENQGSPPSDRSNTASAGSTSSLGRTNRPSDVAPASHVESTSSRSGKPSFPPSKQQLKRARQKVFTKSTETGVVYHETQARNRAAVSLEGCPYRAGAGKFTDAPQSAQAGRIHPHTWPGWGLGATSGDGIAALGRAFPR
jgi:hypothetical protein